MTATLSNVLQFSQKSPQCVSLRRNPIDLTDLTTGPFAITVVSKLKGPAGVESLEPFCVGLAESAGLGRKLNDAFVGLNRSKLPELPDSREALLGNASFSGDNESRSMATPVSNWAACWGARSSDGGVGVRGGIGMGRVGAIATAPATRFRQEERVRVVASPRRKGDDN